MLDEKQRSRKIIQWIRFAAIGLKFLVNSVVVSTRLVINHPFFSSTYTFCSMP